MNPDEFQLTVPSNSSAVYFPNNHPNQFKTMLPASLNLSAEWEVALIDLQYPHNWTNVTQQYLAILWILALEQEEEAQFKDACRSSNVFYGGDPNFRPFEQKINSYLKGKSWNYPGILFVQIPGGYYSDPQLLLDRFLEGLLYFMPNKLVDKFHFQARYDPITKTVKFKNENVSFCNVLSTKDGFFRKAGCVYNQHTEIYVAEPFRTKPHKVIFDELTSMYIYCDIVKYQVVGDTEAPLLGVLPIHGNPNQQVYWGFNPPYYIPLNTERLTSFAIKICDDYGNCFPFDPSGKVVARLDFRRRRMLW